MTEKTAVVHCEGQGKKGKGKISTDRGVEELPLRLCKPFRRRTPTQRSSWVAAHAGDASLTVGAMRVTFWSALAMGLTAGVGALFGTVA